MVQNFIKIFFLFEFPIALLYFFSKTLFANVEVAFLSAFFVVLASAYAHKKMVLAKVSSGEYEEERELLDKIEDPHGLYDTAINDAPPEDLNLREIVKEEKKKVKPMHIKNVKYGLRGAFSPLRIGAYLFLVLGFIALNNNHILTLSYYLPALLLGIVGGSVAAQKLFTSNLSVEED
jgi:hypothetical protein